MFDPFQKPEGAHPAMFRFVLWKRYLDYGRTWLDIAPIKYAIATLAGKLAWDSNYIASVLLFIIYAGIAFLIGMFWHRKKLGKFSLVTLEAEVANTFNDRFMEINEAVKKKNEYTEAY